MKFVCQVLSLFSVAGGVANVFYIMKYIELFLKKKKKVNKVVSFLKIYK